MNKSMPEDYTGRNIISKKQRIFLQIKDDIIHQRFPDGRRLTESEISKLYNISRTPIREIFRRLEHEELVKNFPYKGTFVSYLRNEDIKEIMDLRAALESFAAKCSAQKISFIEIKKINELERQFKNAVKTNNKVMYFNCDINLHNLILDMAGNKRISYIINNLSGQIQRIRFISNNFPERMKKTWAEHFEIMKAIKKKEPELAEKLMRNHIKNTKRLFIDLQK